jgi:hypothetical protein
MQIKVNQLPTESSHSSISYPNNGYVSSTNKHQGKSYIKNCKDRISKAAMFSFPFEYTSPLDKNSHDIVFQEEKCNFRQLVALL